MNRPCRRLTIGDFNYDYDFHIKNGNEAFREFMKDRIWSWVKPNRMVDTNWADRNNDGVDDYPDSMLDFVFVAGPAKDWDTVVQVVVRENDFPDNASTSDHRPVLLSIER